MTIFRNIVEVLNTLSPSAALVVCFGMVILAWFVWYIILKD